MITNRLFYDDVYMQEFTATVDSCVANGDFWEVVLDATAFYPEGGGQPCDIGTINNAKVSHVKEVGDHIVHVTDQPLTPGDKVTGKIDWERRFDLMQQHSGEHIVSGMIHEKYGYENVGFHMGEEFITIDLSGLLNEEELAEIEAKVNEYIWTNQKVNIFVPDKETLASLPYRSKKELTGDVRLVEYPGADLCACCGTHVTYTGEIGLVKLISVHKFRSGVRIEMLCGKRAFAYMNTHVKSNSQVAVALSVKPDQTNQAVARLSKELYEVKGALLAAKRQFFDSLAASCEGKGNVFLCDSSMDAGELRQCADKILNICGGVCVMITGSDEAGYQYVIGEKDGNVRDLVKEWNQAFSGRGGGKPFFAQGKVTGSYEAMKTFWLEKGFLAL